MKYLSFLVASIALAQMLPMGSNFASIGSSNISTTEGGKCEAKDANTCTVTATAGSGVAMVAAIASDGNYTGQASACVANPGSVAMAHVEYFAAPTQTARNVDVWILANATSGLTSATCTLASGSAASFYLQWFADADPVDPVDNVCFGDTANPCTLTTSLNDELLFTVGMYAGGSAVPCDGFTILNDINDTGQSDVAIMAATTAGSYPLTNCGFFSSFTARIGVSLK